MCIRDSKYNDKADLQELINAANKDKEPEKQVKLFKMDKSDELETACLLYTRCV